MAHISRAETSSSFNWTYFPNIGPQERLSTLNSRQGMEGRMLSPGESIRQYLLNKISPGDGIRGTPSRLGEDIWIQAPKLDSQAEPDGPVQLQPLVVLGLLARGLGPKPVAPTKISNYFSLYLFIIGFF